MYGYTCTHTYIHMYGYTCTHTYIHMYGYTCMHTHMINTPLMGNYIELTMCGCGGG